jgi:uncharacterized protein YebE (UPF0316 family)
MMEYIENAWGIALVVLVTQIIFIYLRTVNVASIARNNVSGALISGAGVGLFWMITTTIGVYSITQLLWQPVVAHLVGGAVGTYYGMKTKEK